MSCRLLPCLPHISWSCASCRACIPMWRTSICWCSTHVRRTLSVWYTPTCSAVGNLRRRTMVAYAHTQTSTHTHTHTHTRTHTHTHTHTPRQTPAVHIPRAETALWRCVRREFLSVCRCCVV